MNYSLPEETLILQESVRRFVENELIPLEQELPDRSNSFQLPEKLHAELTAKVREMGLAARDVPEDARWSRTRRTGQLCDYRTSSQIYSRLWCVWLQFCIHAV